jgi:protein-S-isoprenylcysteine O-methyltransferase Ste14
VLFKYLFLIGLIAAEVIRAPHRARNRRARREGHITRERVRGLEAVLLTLSFFGMYLLPVIHVFTDWLAFANYPMPDWVGWIGVATYVCGLWLLVRAHADLGRNWSPSLEITEGQSLVTRGVYGVLRHPIYAAMWLMALAPIVLLPNWIAGWSTLATYLPIYLTRVPREEQMMLEHFGQAYREYMKRTGGIIPRLWSAPSGAPRE